VSVAAELALSVLSGLAVGLAAGAAHGALLWRQVRLVTRGPSPGVARIIIGALPRMAGTAGFLLLGARSGLASALATTLGFLVARTWWVRKAAA